MKFKVKKVYKYVRRVEDYESSSLTALIWGKMCFSDLQKQFTNYFWNPKILLRYVFVTVLFKVYCIELSEFIMPFHFELRYRTTAKATECDLSPSLKVVIADLFRQVLMNPQSLMIPSNVLIFWLPFKNHTYRLKLIFAHQ